MGGLRPKSWASIKFPLCFLSGRLGRMGGPRPRSWATVGLLSCFLLSGFLGRMGGPRPRSWARIGLPLCCLSGLLGRMGGPWPRSWARIGPFILPFELPLCSFFLGLGSDGWAARMGCCQEAGLPLGSLHVSFFLGSWVGWVGPRPRNWAYIGLLSYCLSRLLGGPRHRSWILLCSLRVSFLGSWVGWVCRGQEAGLPLCSLHISFFLGS